MRSTFIISIFAIFFHSAISAQPTKTAQRIVVAGGAITEIIYALGEEHRIVGVDSTSVYPDEATKKAQIGYVRKISAEGILSLNPDLVLGEADTGPKKVISQLKQAGVNLDIFDGDKPFYTIEKKIHHIADLLRVGDEGLKLVHQLTADREALKFITSQITERPNVLFILSIRGGQPIVAGNDTPVHDIIDAAGGHNIVARHISGWKTLSTESAVALNPDVIVTMSKHSNEALLPQIKKLTHFKYSNAVKNKQVYSFDGSYLLGMGPRTPQAVVELAKTLHPNKQLPTDYEFKFPTKEQNNTAKAP